MNSEDLEEIYKREKPRYEQFAAKRLFPYERDLAEDFVQEGFRLALEERDQYRGGSLKAWVFGIIRFQILRYKKKEKTHKGLLKSRTPKEHSQPLNTISYKELMEILSDQLNAVQNEKAFKFFHMVFFEEMSVPEASSRCGISPNNGYVLLHRMRSRLFKALKEKGYEKV